MSSPFELFRKNQAIWMVPLLLLTLFAFTIGDSLYQAGDAGLPSGVRVLITTLCIAGIFWGIGLLQGKGKEYAGTGALLGFALGIVFVTILAPKPDTPVMTNFKNYSMPDLQALGAQRQTANRFIQMLMAKAAENEGREYNEFAARQASFQYGAPSFERDLIIGEILRQEADELGIVVSDVAVVDLIKQVTNSKVNREDAEEVMRKVGGGQSAIYSAVREELKARLAMQALYPTGGLSTPAEYWDLYKTTDYAADLVVAPIKIEPFIGLVDKPDEGTLRSFFAEHKEKFPGIEGEPGFRQPPRVRLGYLEAVYTQVEESLDEITDEEIVAYYEANKENYRNRGGAPAFPTDALPGGDFNPLAPPGGTGVDIPGMNIPGLNGPDIGSPNATEDDATEQRDPLSAPRPGSKTDENAETEDTPEEDTPEEDTTETETGTPDVEKKTDEAGSTDEKTEGEEQSRRNLLQNTQPVSFVQDEESDVKKVESTEEKSDEEGAEKNDGDEPPAEEKPNGDDPAEGSSNPNEDKKTDETDAEAKDESTDTEKPGEAPSEKPGGDPFSDLPEPADDNDTESEYRPLDDELKSEIRDAILREKTEAKMQVLTTRAYDLLTTLREDYIGAIDEEEREELRKSITAGMKEFAEENGLVYRQTPLMTQEQLATSENHPIGRATKPIPESQRFTATPETAADIAFRRDTIFMPQTVTDEVGTRNAYVFWRLEFRQPEVPEYDDEGIADQVEETYLEVEARKLAEERAKELAGKLNEEDAAFDDVIVGKTMTGQDEIDGDELLFKLDLTSFREQERSTAPGQNPFQMETLQPGQIQGQNPLSREFFDLVFDELKAGEAGVAPTADRETFFVVLVKDKRPSTEEARQESYKQFLKSGLLGFTSPFQRQIENDFQQVVGNLWMKELFDKYNVQFQDEVPAN